ncbi:Os05g0452700 [Oryza sativa Japonica Group]|uniref:Os05g0452700 protein n=1 Tax=Oryza sativa subsp. japonica TaxID=39947 RepID=C7J2I8_ORYSJ|nr:Os05g0452700 [Oryza sativa Japonica Group]|eukprot:NP_001174453.1 Os05g0452700 [Oryza sativa Japonica Group]
MSRNKMSISSKQKQNQAMSKPGPVIRVMKRSPEKSQCCLTADIARSGYSALHIVEKICPAPSHFIFASVKRTCLLTRGSYFLNSSFSVIRRGFLRFT